TRGAAPGARQPSAAIAWLPTLVAKGPEPLQREHLRRQPVALRAGRLHCIVLDTSGSMRQRGRLALAKGHATLMIEQAARQGDDVALLRFGGQGVELLLPPGRARASGSQRLRPVGGGGGTPLAEALAQAERLLQRALRVGGPTECWLWLLTDGRTLEQPQAPLTPQHLVIVDFDDPKKSLGRCAAWAARWGAEHHLAQA
ncbi:MAG: VWA domain-containing protein, partial [Polaromonas sp.]